MHTQVFFVILSIALSVLALPTSTPEAALDEVVPIAALPRHVAPLIGLKEDKRGYRGTKNPRDQQDEDESHTDVDMLTARGGFRGSSNGKRDIEPVVSVDLNARGGFRGTKNGKRDVDADTSIDLRVRGGFRGTGNGRRDPNADVVVARGGFRGSSNGKRDAEPVIPVNLIPRGGFRGASNGRSGRREAAPGFRGSGNGKRDADLSARGGFRGTGNH